MALYEVHARKWENGWELRIDGVGLTWSPSLDGAEGRAREYIATSMKLAEKTIHINLIPRVNADLDQVALEARRAVHDADEAMRGAAVKTREAVYGLSGIGLSRTDISHYLGLSQQRITKLTES